MKMTDYSNERATVFGEMTNKAKRDFRNAALLGKPVQEYKDSGWSNVFPVTFMKSSAYRVRVSRKILKSICQSCCNTEACENMGAGGLLAKCILYSPAKSLKCFWALKQAGLHAVGCQENVAWDQITASGWKFCPYCGKEIERKV